jgi:hypothetical protein
MLTRRFSARRYLILRRAKLALDSHCGRALG